MYYVPCTMYYVQCTIYNVLCTVVELQGGAGGGGLAPLVVLKAPLVQLIFRGSGGAAKRSS